MDKELIRYITSNIDERDFEYAYSKMCLERTWLREADYSLFRKIEDLVEEFLEENDLTYDWFCETFGDIEELFEVIY